MNPTEQAVALAKAITVFCETRTGLVVVVGALDLLIEATVALSKTSTIPDDLIQEMLSVGPRLEKFASIDWDQLRKCTEKTMSIAQDLMGTKQ